MGKGQVIPGFCANKETFKMETRGLISRSHVRVDAAGINSIDTFDS